jgi:ABC-type microcin C transport system permease subunit YejB
MFGQSASPPVPEPRIAVKRQVTVKSIITPRFRDESKQGMTQELQALDQQAQQLEGQYQNALQQLQALAQQDQPVQNHIEQLNHEVQEKRHQLAALKADLTNKLAGLDKMADGDFITTGMLENYVELAVGDNIFQRVRQAEIIIEDGIIQSIKL